MASRCTLVLATLMLVSDVRPEPAGFADRPPEIGIFAVQAPESWQREQQDPAAPALSGVSPISLFSDAGVTWVRLPLMNHMRRLESGEWTFPKDRFVEELRGRGIKIFATISLGTLSEDGERPARFTEQPGPEQEAQWLEAVQALVRHYRGAVWVWQIGNEIEKTPIDVESYLRMFESGSRTIREIDPGAAVAAAGFSAGDFETFVETTWPALLRAETPPDLLDLHFHRYAGTTALLDERLSRLAALRDRHLPGAGLIVTENSTFTGRKIPYPWENDRKITQTEADQAAESIKRAAVTLGHGASVSFGTDLDKRAWRKQALHPFTHNGLVYQPDRTYRGRVRTWPKSAWWSLRLMTTLLLPDGAPIDAVRHDVTGAGTTRADVTLFSFSGGLYLAWTERRETGAVRLVVPGIADGQADVIRAVPRVDGKRIEGASWRDRFPVQVVNVEDGAVTVDLSRTPVWILTHRDRRP